MFNNLHGIVKQQIWNSDSLFPGTKTMILRLPHTALRETPKLKEFTQQIRLADKNKNSW